jgi:ABC-type iron transport system FetAB permease component
MKVLPLAQTTDDRINEFLNDPSLTVACVLLIVVSAGWVVVSRLIVRNYRKAALRGRTNQVFTSGRDIWTAPP